MSTKILHILFLMIFLFSSCGKEDHWSNDRGYKQVLLIYLAVDNNLSSEGLEKLDLIAKYWHKDDGHEIIAYLDQKNKETQLLRLDVDKKFKPIQTLQPHSAVDPNFLQELLINLRNDFPSESYGLLYFSHASGWLPENTLNQLNNTRLEPVINRAKKSEKEQKSSIGIDRDQEMELYEFAHAIPNNFFEYIVFEACYMAGIEVAYELKDKTKYILASSSELFSPGFSYVYPNAINQLVGKQKNLFSFAQKAFNFWNQASLFTKSCTLSLINTEDIQQLADWIKKRYHLFPTINHASVQCFDRGTTQLFFDFRTYVAPLAKSDQEMLQLDQILSNIVLWKNNTDMLNTLAGDQSISTHSGLTCYIPQQQYSALWSAYQKLAWYKAIAP